MPFSGAKLSVRSLDRADSTILDMKIVAVAGDDASTAAKSRHRWGPDLTGASTLVATSLGNPMNFNAPWKWNYLFEGNCPLQTSTYRAVEKTN